LDLLGVLTQLEAAMILLDILELGAAVATFVVLLHSEDAWTFEEALPGKLVPKTPPPAWWFVFLEGIAILDCLGTVAVPIWELFAGVWATVVAPAGAVVLRRLVMGGVLVLSSLDLRGVCGTSCVCENLLGYKGLSIFTYFFHRSVDSSGLDPPPPPHWGLAADVDVATRVADCECVRRGSAGGSFCDACALLLDLLLLIPGNKLLGEFWTWMQRKLDSRLKTLSGGSDFSELAEVVCCSSAAADVLGIATVNGGACLAKNGIVDRWVFFSRSLWVLTGETRA
jgi:hypothetical protein